MQLARITCSTLIGAALATPLFASAEASASPFERQCRGAGVPLAPGETRCNDGFFIRASGYTSVAQAYLHQVQVDGSESYAQRVTARGNVVGFDVVDPTTAKIQDLQDQITALQSQIGQSRAANAENAVPATPAQQPKKKP